MAKQEWYVYMLGEVTGPFGENVVTQMLKQNRLQFTDFGWTKGMADWMRFTEVEAFADLMPPAPDVPVPDTEAVEEEEEEEEAPPPPPAKVVPMRARTQAAAASIVRGNRGEAGAKLNALPAQGFASAVARQAVASPPKAAPRAKAARAPAMEVVEEVTASAETQKPTRRMWRVPIDATVTLQGHGEFRVLDISEGGLLLECHADDSLEIGTDLRLRISSPSFPKPLDMTALLVREEDFDGKRCYGVEFTKVNPAHKRTLASYVASKLQLGE